MRELTLPHKHEQHEFSAIIKDRLPSEKAFNNGAEIFKLLADQTRLKIFWILCHTSECVYNIASLCNISSPATCHHLRALKKYGLITARQVKKEKYYTAIDNEKTKQLHKVIEKIISVSCPIEELSYSSSQTVIKSVHSYILENLDKKLTTAQLSKKFLINQTTLKEVFKKTYGESIALHVKKHRLEKAKELLEISKLSISQIAKSVGYESQSKFSIAFYNEYKILPSNFKKQKTLTDL